ncbi:hypothetical protein [Gallaecimonas pentaromativorans]|uniref:hypothetical protein n=1 Tax=Gallaecimonas pentaromativorans TaxID=584787 RepID=UPI003A8E1B35
MFAPLNGAPLNGGATGLWAEGTASAEAQISVSADIYSIESVTMPSRQANSESSAVGLRITSAPTAVSTASASAEGVGLRITSAPTAGGTASAESEATPIRMAGFDAELIIEAVAELAYERHAYLDAISLIEAQSTADNARRTRAKAKSSATAFVAADGLRPVFAEIDLYADADTTADIRVTKTADSTAVSVSEQAAAAVRQVVPDAILDAVGDTEGEYWRHAYMDGAATSGSDAVAAEPSSRGVALVYMGGSIEARSFAPDVPPDRTAWAKLARARTQTISWLDESDVDVLRVRQRYAMGTAVARSSTRAVPNTILGYSQVYVQSESVTDPDKLWLVRGVEGQCTGEVDATTRTSRITVIEGNPIGEAFTHIAPTITRDGVAYSYATGQSEAEAEQWFNALNYTWAPAGLSPAQSDAVLTPYMDRDGRGDVVATAGTAIVTRINPWVFAKGRATVTAQTEAEPIHYRSIYGESVMEPTAETQAEPIHYRSIYADAVLDATADSEAEPTHYRSIYAEADLVAIADPVVKANRLRWVGMDGSTTARSGQLAEAIRYRWVGMRAKGVAVSAPVAEAVRLRWVGMEALAVSVSDQLAENGVTYRVSANDAYANVISIAQNRRWTSGQGTSHSYARGGPTQVTIFHVWYAKSLMRPTADQRAVAFRITSAPPGQCTARASVGRGSFIINPGAAAPDRRTIVVPATDLSMTVAATNREYQVA